MTHKFEDRGGTGEVSVGAGRRGFTMVEEVCDPEMACGREILCWVVGFGVN